MPFPKTKRVLFQNNPLIEVVCQVRFPPVLQIAAEEPAAFQEKVRAKYPLYRRDEATQIPADFRHIVAQLRISSLSDQLIHVFLSEDQKRFISLGRESLALTDRRYSRWEEFRDEMAAALTALSELYTPPFYTRIGLRYRDVVDRKKLGLNGQPWDTLLCKPLVGLLGESAVSDRIANFSSDVLVKLDEVKAGFIRMRHSLVSDQEGKTEGFLFDADFFTQERSEPKDVGPTLDIFNRIAGNYFRWAITPKLRAALKPTDLE
jgi:uncharacterized protein (TIGR04255 family)